MTTINSGSVNINASAYAQSLKTKVEQGESSTTEAKTLDVSLEGTKAAAPSGAAASAPKSPTEEMVEQIEKQIEETQKQLQQLQSQLAAAQKSKGSELEKMSQVAAIQAQISTVSAQLVTLQGSLLQLQTQGSVNTTA